MNQKKTVYFDRAHQGAMKIYRRKKKNRRSGGKLEKTPLLSLRKKPLIEPKKRVLYKTGVIKILNRETT